jgi:sulfur carrier protein ThiS adenylyltransferase
MRFALLREVDMGANTYLTERERHILENAKVGIAGAGGLGSNVAMLLVRAGMKKLVIADFDIVNESNLNRQFFFRRQLGEKKIAALAENLRMIESDLDLSLHDVRLTPENADFVFAGCNVVVEAFDSAEAKAMLLHSLLPTGKPIVSAIGLAGWGRSNDIRMRKVGRNLILVGDQTRDVRDGFAPVGVRVGIAAAMQANSVVSLLLGEEP